MKIKINKKSFKAQLGVHEGRKLPLSGTRGDDVGIVPKALGTTVKLGQISSHDALQSFPCF